MLRSLCDILPSGVQSEASGVEGQANRVLAMVPLVTADFPFPAGFGLGM
jgi:hypothetical protein